MASRRYAADYTVPAMADVPPDTISADFPFESRYAAVDGVRLHYIDEGSGPPVLFLHGSPTWSYIWRNVIPHLSSRFRCVALDLAGMGMSEKPDVEYRLFDHARYVEGFIASLGLRGLTLVMHDWGSKLGFHYARRHESNVRASALLGSMFMPIASWSDIPDDFRETLRAWRGDAGWDLIVQRNVFFENVLPSGVVRTLTDEELRRYRAPYADEAARRVLWQWPREIPIEGEPADTAAAMTSVNDWLGATPIPMLLFHATPGGLGQAPMVEWLRSNVANIETVHLGEGVHFLQEDHPHRIGRELSRWLAALNLS